MTGDWVNFVHKKGRGKIDMGVGILQEKNSPHLRSSEFGLPNRGSTNLFVFFISVNSLIPVVSDCRAVAVV